MKAKHGFALIELLIVMVVVSVLSVLYYTYSTSINTGSGIQKKSPKTIKQEASDLILKTDLANASSLLKMYQAENGIFPQTNDCNATPAEDSICLRASEGVTLTYEPNDEYGVQDFVLTAANASGITYRITNDIAPELVTEN